MRIILVYLLLFASMYAKNAYCQADSIGYSAEGSNVAKANELYFEAQKAKMHNDEKKATQLFEEFVTLEPGNPAAFYELSKLYAADKRYDKAETLIKTAISLSKDNKWYNDHYARVLGQLGKYTEAAQKMADIADKEIGDANYAVIAAEYYERAQNNKMALAYMDKAILRSGEDEDMLRRKVQMCLHMNNVDEAAKVVKQLIAQDPHNGKFYKLLGEIYDNNKMPEKAFDVYINAEKSVPGDPSIQMGLSEYYLKRRDTANFRVYAKKAIVNNKLDLETQLELFFTYINGMSDSVQNVEGMPILTELLKQHPADPQLIGTYGEFLESDKQLEKAAEQYKKSLAIKPGNFIIWERLLSVYTDKPHADSLVKYSEKAMRLFPNQVLAHYYNAVARYNKEDYTGAIKTLNRAIDMASENNTKQLSGLYSLLGDVYHQTKQYAQSDDAFKKALHNEPNNATVLNNFAYYLSERGQKLDEAEKMSAKSLKLRPDEATFLDTYGWILYKKGDYNGAKENIEKAIAKAGGMSDATLYHHLGDVYYKLNNKTKAVQCWKTAKEKGGNEALLDKKISEEKLYE